MPKLTSKDLERYYSEVKELLKCPVCYDYVVPPVTVCSNGHVTCNRCLTSVTKCPLCKMLLTPSKQTLLDNLMEILPYPCIYNEEGCDEVGTLKSRSKHINNCPYRKSKCVQLHCKWSGKTTDLLDHFRNKHSNKLWVGEQFVIRFHNFALQRVMDKVRIISAFGNQFFFRFRNYPHEKCCIAAVQTVGPVENADNFDYYLEFSSVDKKVSASFCNKTHSDTELVFERKNRSFSLTHQVLDSFISKGSLAGKLTIKRKNLGS